MPRWRHILHEMTVSQWPSTINDWPMWWEYNSLSAFTVHVFRFMAGEEGQTKQGTLDVLNADRGLPLGILLAEDGYTFRKFFVSPSSVLLFWEGSSLLWRDILILKWSSIFGGSFGLFKICGNIFTLGKTLGWGHYQKRDCTLNFSSSIEISTAKKNEQDPIHSISIKSCSQWHWKISEITLCTETSFVVVRKCCLIEAHELIITLQPTTPCYYMKSVNNRAYP